MIPMWWTGAAITVVVLMWGGGSVASTGPYQLADFTATPSDPLDAGIHALGLAPDLDPKTATIARAALDFSSIASSENARPNSILMAAKDVLDAQGANPYSLDAADYVARLAELLDDVDPLAVADRQFELIEQMLATPVQPHIIHVDEFERHTFDSLPDAVIALLAATGITEVDAASQDALASLYGGPIELQTSIQGIIEALLDMTQATALADASGDYSITMREQSRVVRAVREAYPHLQPIPTATPALVRICGALIIDLAGFATNHPESCRAALSVDLGGSDKYYNHVGGGGTTDFGLTPPLPCPCIPPTPTVPQYATPVAIAIDVSGNDDYYLVPQDPLEIYGPLDSLIDSRWDLRGAYGGAVGGGFGALFDFAGHDEIGRLDSYYGTPRFSAGAGHTGGVGLYVDLAGNDDRRDFLGSGYGMSGAGFAFDGGGNDYYAQSQAMGINGGIGVLVDVAGNDYYQAQEGNGASFIGIGFLADLGVSGWDQYIGLGASSQAEINGANTIAGAAVLLDVGGRNDFITGPRQNANGGHRAFSVAGGPDVSGGGLALLLSGTGDDTYISESFGGVSTGAFNGAASSLGFGAIVDQGGNNAYSTTNRFLYPNSAIAFAQGAAGPGGVGMIVDAGTSSAFSIGDHVRGQGSSANGVGLIVQTVGSGVTTYGATTNALPSLATGGGVGMRLHRGDFALAGLEPNFQCPPEDLTVFGVTDVTVVGNRVVTAHVCMPSSASSEEPLRDPLTNEPMNSVPRPGVPCNGHPGCAIVENQIGPDTRAWLEADEATMTVGGGLEWISGNNGILSQYTVATADDACQVTCEAAQRALAI